MSKALAALFEHNLWANLRLLDACANLTDAQLDAKVPGTYGTVRDTLLHILGAEEGYVLLLAGGEVKRPVREEDFPDFEELRSWVAKSGNALIEYAREVDSDAIARGIRRGEPYAIPVTVLLTQAINHATEHRAQISTILTEQGVEPPDFSGWAWWDATERSKDV